MTVDVTAIPNTGSRRRSHSIVPDRGDDYVLGGCTLTYNGSRLAVSAGQLTIADGDTVYAVEIGGVEFQPASDGTVYVDVDPAGPSGDVVLQSSAPSAPALAIGRVDVSAGTTTELNRDPTLAARSVTTEEATINNSVTYPDGTTVTTSPSGGGGTADTTVSSASGLESAFSNLSQGEHLHISQPSTSYLTDQWLDIDVNGVTITTDSPFAEDGSPLVQAADGSDIGGIRVGNASAVSKIVIDGFGWDGNYENQTDSINHKDAIRVDQGTNVRIQNCYLQDTAPHEKHGNGGDGISVLHRSSDIWVLNNRIDNAGDRSIQVAGNRIVVGYNNVSNGYDRGTSLQVQSDPNDGNDYEPWNVVVIGNHYRDITNGSCIGHNNGINNNGRNFSIIGNQARGNLGAFVTMRGEAHNVTIMGNVGQQESTSRQSGAFDIEGALREFAVVGNSVEGFQGSGISCAANSRRGTIAQNTVRNVGTHGVTVNGTQYYIGGNIIYNADGAGVYSTGGDTTIASNQIKQSGDAGINQQSVTGGTLIHGNAVSASQQNANASPEILIDNSESLIIGNYCNQIGRFSVFREESNAAKNLYVGNRGPDNIGGMFGSIDATSWGYANFPALFTAEGSVTLSTGSTPAARINGVDATEGIKPDATVTPDPGASQPAADYSWESYLEWDDTAGAWDLVVEWRTDPGSDVSGLYEVTREPTSRAIKGL